MKPRDYQREDVARVTKQVKVRIWLDDIPKVEATRVLGYSLADILLAGCEALQAKYWLTDLDLHQRCSAIGLIAANRCA